MDEITHDDESPQTKGELTFLSPKRARTDCAGTDGLTGNSYSESIEPLTLQKTIGFPSSGELPETEGLTLTAGCGNFQDGKPHDQSQFTPLVYVAMSNSAKSGSSEVCFISTERDLVLLKRNEQPSVTGADQLSLFLTDGTGGSPLPASANTPSLPACKQLGKPPKDEPADSCSLSAGNEADEEVRCQSDSTSEDAVHDTGLCNTQSQLAEVLETNQRREELEFCKAEAESPISSRDHAEFKPLYSKSEEDPSGNLENKLDLQICENENIFTCDGETKGEVNESKTFIPSAAESEEGSGFSYQMVLIRNTAAEKVSLDVNNSWADDEESAEGDNDEDAFGVIDSAIRSKADEEAEGMSFNCEGSVGREKACEMETCLPLCSEVGAIQKVSSADPAEQFAQQSRTQPCRAKNELHSPAYAYTLNNTTETLNVTGDEDSCQRKSRALNPPPAGDGGTQESHGTEEQQLKEQPLSSCFPNDVDHRKTQVVGYSQREADEVEMTAEIKKKGLNFLEKTESDEQKLETQNKKEDAFAADQSEDKAQTPTQLRDEHEGLLDQMSVTAEREKRKEGINVTEGMKTEEKSEDDVQKQSEHKEDARQVPPSDWTERSILAFCNGEDQEQSLSCFSDHQNRADTHVSENKVQLSAFTFHSLSDAVVPCQQDLTPSQEAHHSSTALRYHGRYASTFCRVLEGFDTFKKIQLLPDDGDDDEASGLGDMPDLTSLPRQLVKTLQQQLYMPVAESDTHMEIPEEKADEAGKEEDVERSECHTESTANGNVSSSCNKVPNSTPAGDFVALGWPEQLPDHGSACDSSEHTHNELKPQLVPAVSREDSSSDLNSFEMKEPFDRVLKELNLFFEISRSDLADDCSSSPEQQSDASPSFERISPNNRDDLSDLKPGHHRNTSTDEAVEDLHMEICGGDSGVSLAAVSSDGEQEVPLNRHPCWETSMDTHKEPSSKEQKGKSWSPSFMCLPLLEQLSHRPPEQMRRLEPLPTCTRPIRVGLSRRARTKHLHSSHPYK